MTKRINKIFLIIAICFLLFSILIPVIDYYMTKAKLTDKGQFTNVDDYVMAGTNMAKSIGIDISATRDFYIYFNQVYAIINKNSIMFGAVESLTNGEFAKVISWTPYTEPTETMFLFYIFDKIVWLFVAYCIFVIPISMVDIFSKAIRKGVE